MTVKRYGESVRVELYGVPRHRAGIDALNVEAQTLGEALAAISTRLPVLDDVCFDNGRLRGGYLANINGRTFVSDPATALSPGDCVLIVSTDMGG